MWAGAPERGGGGKGSVGGREKCGRDVQCVRAAQGRSGKGRGGVCAGGWERSGAAAERV